MQLVNYIQSILPGFNFIWVMVILGCAGRIYYTSIEKYRTPKHPAFIGLYTKQYQAILKTMPNGTYALASPFWLDHDIFAVLIAMDGKIKKYYYTEHSTHYLLRNNHIILSFYNDIDNPYAILNVPINEIIGDGYMKFKTHNVLENLPITATLNQSIKDKKIDVSSIHIEPDPYYADWTSGKKQIQYHHMIPFIPGKTVKMDTYSRLYTTTDINSSTSSTSTPDD